MPNSSSSYWDQLHQLWDNTMRSQRLERLAQCRLLEDLRKDCYENNNTTTTTTLEDCPAGIRMVRYFDWRDYQTDNCQRTEHAVWACRAVALQCGAELVALRQCFAAEGREKVLGEASSYEGTLQGVCADLQKKVGDCVRQKALSLSQASTARNEEG